ncbi:probable ATP-dependent RNA helicase DDX5 [Rhipicephalus sanguineus]|nr:probable ATP-dependent RNA helicase DDX5 [Rhipicephalus sanguineus]
MDAQIEGVPGQNVKPGFPRSIFAERDHFRPVMPYGDLGAVLFLNTRFFGEAPTGRTTRAGRNLRAPPFQKDFYREHITTAQRPMEEVEAYRKANDIVVTGGDVPKPILHIDEAGLPEHISKVIKARNPGSGLTAMQAQCWPVALRGKDLVTFIYDVSEGKHLAYLVPTIIHILHQPAELRDYGPLVLVLTATREAALQVREIADELKVKAGIRTMYLLPGEPREPQLKELEEGAEIYFATPGRLVYFMKERKISLRRCSYLVLDGADLMMTMGFGKQLRIIAHNTRPDRQTLVWLSSRTMDAKQLIDELTSDYVTVSIGAATHEDPTRRVQHIVHVCEMVEKERELEALLNDVLTEEGDKAIVFVERKETVEGIVCSLSLQGWAAVSIHGTKTEQEREVALNTCGSAMRPYWWLPTWRLVL